MKKLFTLTASCLILLVSAQTFAQKKADTLKKATKVKATTAATTTKTTAAEAVNKSADKAIGKDSKGKTIYLGPKGGQYTLSEAGKKQYIKTADKIKVN